MPASAGDTTDDAITRLLSRMLDTGAVGRAAEDQSFKGHCYAFLWSRWLLCLHDQSSSTSSRWSLPYACQLRFPNKQQGDDPSGQSNREGLAPLEMRRDQWVFRMRVMAKPCSTSILPDIRASRAPRKFQRLPALRELGCRLSHSEPPLECGVTVNLTAGMRELVTSSS